MGEIGRGKKLREGYLPWLHNIEERGGEEVILSSRGIRNGVPRHDPPSFKLFTGEQERPGETADDAEKSRNGIRKNARGEGEYERGPCSNRTMRKKTVNGRCTQPGRKGKPFKEIQVPIFHPAKRWVHVV